MLKRILALSLLMAAFAISISSCGGGAASSRLVGARICCQKSVSSISTAVQLCVVQEGQLGCPTEWKKHDCTDETILDNKCPSDTN